MSATSIDDVHSYSSEMHSDYLVDIEDAEDDIETGNELVSTIDYYVKFIYLYEHFHLSRIHSHFLCGLDTSSLATILIKMLSLAFNAMKIKGNLSITSMAMQ